MTRTDPMPALAYATPSTSTGSPVAAGFWIMLGGLVVIFFGGCFYIGVLAITSPNLFNGPMGAPPAGPMTWEQHTLMFTLFAIGITCLVTGAWILSLGIRKLLSVGR